MNPFNRDAVLRAIFWMLAAFSDFGYAARNTAREQGAYGKPNHQSKFLVIAITLGCLAVISSTAWLIFQREGGLVPWGVRAVLALMIYLVLFLDARRLNTFQYFIFDMKMSRFSVPAMLFSSFWGFLIIDVLTPLLPGLPVGNAVQGMYLIALAHGAFIRRYGKKTHPVVQK